MKRVLLSIIATISGTLLMAQDLSQFKALDDSLFLNNEAYVNGNKYQRDAMLFVDMLSDTHPYYIKKERREQLFAGEKALLAKCAACDNDSDFVSLLIETLGDLHDKHTDVIDLKQLNEKRKAAQQQQQALDEPSDAVMANWGDLFHYIIFPERQLCYLQFNQCADARTMGNEYLPRWDTMLDEMFAEMKENGIKNLIVDAQYNNGGSSMLCDELLIRLRPFEQLRTLTSSLRFSRLMGAYNPRIAIAKQSWEADGHIDELYPMPAGAVGPDFVQPEVFEGNVIFVQGEKTYSSAGILMTLARDNHIGIIAGSNSTFSPSHYGEILPYRLPNTDIIGTISCKFFARPDAEHVDDKTLVPDVAIDLSDKEELWDEILKIIDNNAKTSK
ncbi:MAG: hypothetical protein KBT00_01070 [Bacteroidales bacterium]|nr:hypothetical protein [Candidatus Cacconaster merdequi]